MKKERVMRKCLVCVFCVCIPEVRRLRQIRSWIERVCVWLVVRERAGSAITDQRIENQWHEEEEEETLSSRSRI